MVGIQRLITNCVRGRVAGLVPASRLVFTDGFREEVFPRYRAQVLVSPLELTLTKWGHFKSPRITLLQKKAGAGGRWTSALILLRSRGIVP